jgi:nucleotide-binding universal stress UspA family protein
MKPIKKILVPLDFSPHSKAALDFAVDLARRYEAGLELLYVYEPLTYTLPEGYVLVTPEQLSEILNKLQAQLETVRSQARSAGASQVATTLLQGGPVTEILRFARERDADLIVMGTHGRTGIKRLFIGSVAENVVRSSSCPVLTVRDHSEAEKPG